MIAVKWKLLKLLCQNQSWQKMTFLGVNFYLWPRNEYVSCWTYNFSSFYKKWKLYIEKYSSFCVKLMCFLSFWPWPLTPKCYRVKTSVGRTRLLPWPLNPKLNRYLWLIILHICMKYESFMLKTTQVIVSESKCWQCSVCDLDFWTIKVLQASSTHHPAFMYEI